MFCLKRQGVSGAGVRRVHCDIIYPMNEHEPAWAFECSIECGVTVEFAWKFWTNVRNWALDPDVESIEIDGPFAAGAHGTTNSRSSGLVNWRIVEAQAGRAVIEFPLAGAVARFCWIFEPAAAGARITQWCTLEGDRAGTYVKDFGPSLEAGMPAGMRKLCAAMESAAQAQP